MAIKVSKLIPSAEEIDRLVAQRIRQRYDENEEIKMLRKGIIDPSDPEFAAYNAYVEEQRQWGRWKKESLGFV